MDFTELLSLKKFEIMWYYVFID